MRNEQLVVEAAMDTEDAFKCEIPGKLLDLLRLDVPDHASEVEIEEVSLMFLYRGRRPFSVTFRGLSRFFWPG